MQEKLEKDDISIDSGLDKVVNVYFATVINLLLPESNF